MRIKLYISPCPNDTFMFDALVNGRIDTRGVSFDVEYYDIEELNNRALLAEADVTKVSCAILPDISFKYRISSSGAALGRGNGPLLVRRKGETTHITSVATPGAYTTANALVSRLYPEIKERRYMLFSDVAASVERGDVDAGVLIHEGRFVYQRYNLELVADLGLVWEERMGLPLPLGAIALRRGLKNSHKIETLIHESILYALENPMVSREYVKSHAQEVSDEVIDAHIKLFVNDYSLQLDDQGYFAISQLNNFKF